MAGMINKVKRQQILVVRGDGESQRRLEMAPSHLVIVFVATAGQNGENLGSDEAQIVLFVYLLYDVSKNKVRDTFCYLERHIFEIMLYRLIDLILSYNNAHTLIQYLVDNVRHVLS